MFNIDWPVVAKQIADKLQDNNQKNAILKMKADLFVMNLANGLSQEDAWTKANEAAKFFEKKLGTQ